MCYQKYINCEYHETLKFHLEPIALSFTYTRLKYFPVTFNVANIKNQFKQRSSNSKYLHNRPPLSPHRR